MLYEVITYLLHDIELYVTQCGLSEVCNVYLYSLQVFAFANGIEWLEVHRPKGNSGQVELIEVTGQLVGFDPRGCKHLERNGVTYAD